MHSMVRWIFLAGCLALGGSVAAQTLFSDSFEPPFQAPIAHGGSNYLWFGQAPGCANDAREDFALLALYHTNHAGTAVRSIAQQQLATMHARGMRRLSLGFHFMHQPASGTLVDSSSPAQVAQVAQNLALLLADIKAAGFNEVLFRLFPVNNMSPSDGAFPAYSSNANSPYAARVNDYWNLIETMRPVLVAAGVPYRFDLMVEGMPRDSDPPVVSDPWKYPANERWSRATRELWQRYRTAYGINDTVGFSFLVDDNWARVKARVRHMRYVYEGVYPHVFAADFYASANADERAKFTMLHDAMVQQNPSGAAWNSTGWIIAEAYYEDPLAAAAIGEAIATTGRAVFYLTQWPLDRAGECIEGATEQIHVNTLPPYRWTVWGGTGY